MTSSTRAWVWGAVAVVVIVLGIWWFSAHPSSNVGPAGYGAPEASTTGALQSPTSPVVEENRNSSTVLGIIGSLTNESRFNGLLSNTAVSSLIAGKGPYTVFVPTDASFGQLPAGTINNLTSAQLKRLVEYHVISGKMIDVNAQTAGTVVALSKDPLNFSYQLGDKSARVNSSAVIYAYKASNGIVYVIGSVLLPPLPASR